ncbi:VC0807 family protein [Paraburkholderia aromaticivorans]|uniref:VC0807 family protein n=1 Tax=Paraburkholderia aromaticivorans TaxID=2026199 RepID=UPI001455E3F8|nr:VC0807 family protein [Paraburkholderia aromaticivorans]
MKLHPGFVLELAVNFLLPWLAYRLALPHLGETGALIASAVPPIVWSLIELARFRRVDALSVMVVAGIVLSVAAMALGGSPRMLLLRESLVSGAVGVVFLLSLPMRRPLIFYLARATVAREMEGGAARFEALWQERPALVSAMRLMTLVWGVGLTGETALRAWMALTWPIERFLVVSPFIGYGIYGGLTLWTFWYRKTMRGRVEAHVQSGGAAG